MPIVRYSLLPLTALLAGCALLEETPAPPAVETAPQSISPSVPIRAPGDIQRIGELERQLAREQRQNLADKKRLEQALKDLKEAQKLNEELQSKIDALLAIDHDLRNRERIR